jgi:chemotaxis protein methyltransferase CheR
MVELGIVDIREIIRLIKTNYNFDFSNYALTSLKYRLEHVIAKNNLSAPESLFRKLSDQPDFFDTFLNQVSVSSTEMFRDPSFWRWLRESFLPSFDDKYFENFKIWLPHCTSGGELYTLTIVLKELNLLHKVKIYATSLSKESIEYIKSGVYPLKKIEVSAENYIRFQGELKFENYYHEEKYNAVRDTSLIKNVEFINDDINFNNAPKNLKLILLRNVMIYFNPTFQDKVLLKMHELLSANGNLAIGLKEQIKNSVPVLFEPVNLNENIYKKKQV